MSQVPERERPQRPPEPGPEPDRRPSPEPDREHPAPDKIKDIPLPEHVEPDNPWPR